MGFVLFFGFSIIFYGIYLAFTEDVAMEVENFYH